MDDIVVGIGCIFVLSLAALQFGRAIGNGKNASAWAAAIVVLTFLYGGFIHGNVSLAEWFPISNIIVVSNCFPVLAAWLAGVVGADTRALPHRRHALAAALLVAGWFSVVWNTVTPALDSDNQYLNGVCLQSTKATCSACSIVTLLSIYGIESTEEEMARLCLTSGRGTQLLGIYRGLVLKTEGTPYRVEIVRGEFGSLTDSQFPLVAPVKRVDFTSNVSVASFVGFNGLLELLGTSEHCVVMVKVSSENKVEIADPASRLSNPIQLPVDTAARSWTDVGYRLVKR